MKPVHSTTKEVLPATASSGMPKPEFFRLPKKGGDEYFGLTRSWYYAAEKQGLVTLVRLRHRGKIRGVTLVPYDAVKKLIEEARK